VRVDRVNPLNIKCVIYVDVARVGAGVFDESISFMKTWRMKI